MASKKTCTTKDMLGRVTDDDKMEREADLETVGSVHAIKNTCTKACPNGKIPI